MGRFCHPSTMAGGPLPGHAVRPDGGWFQLHFLGSELPPQVSLALANLTILLSLRCVFGILSSLAETKLILGAQGEFKTCHYLTGYPSWNVAPACRVCFPLLLFLSIIDWHYLGCQWDHAGICLSRIKLVWGRITI